MAGPSSYVQTNFLGGEISATAQGRLELPAYRVSLVSCLNAFPIETGAWMRRPGTRFVAHTRGGGQGRNISFDFEQAFPYNMQFSDGYLRFTAGPALVMTNDAQAVVAVSTANPAVVQTTTAHGWSTGDTVMFNSLGSNNPLLQNRQFTITVVDTTHFSIADALTAAAIDGSTLGTFVSGNVTRVMELATTYTNGAWSSVRSVQAEERSLLLNGTHPQVLQVESDPTATQYATFSLGPGDFIDGPYLDPLAGSLITPNGLNGLVTFTLSFSAYDSTRAYNINDFVTSGGVNYQSLTALNVGNTPASSTSNWAVVNGGAAINDGRGFVASDVGRLIRLFSEPSLWASGTAYTAGNVVAYADGNGGSSYWIATASSTGIQPGTDATKWAINATGAQWTWAQITSVSGSGLISPVSAVGNMTVGGGLSAAFTGSNTKSFASAAGFTNVITTYPQWNTLNWSNGALVQYQGVGYQALISILVSSGSPVWDSSTAYSGGVVVQWDNFLWVAATRNQGVVPGSNGTFWTKDAAINAAPPAGNTSLWQIAVSSMPQPTEKCYVGQHYSVAKQIVSATAFPSTDVGFLNSPNGGLILTINLRAKSTAPANSSDGTLLGTSGPISNSFSPVTITSSNQVSTWSYVWLEFVSTYLQPLPVTGSNTFTAEFGVSQAQFYAPDVANGSVVTAQIRGSALLYNQTIRTWRLGVYSDTTGWPACGTYHEGRVWFAGVVENRFDASVSNGFNGVELDFTPTAPDGTVGDANAVSYTCTGPSVNQFVWMEPDQQGILCGTQAGEWMISAPSPGALTPTNVRAARITKIGCANIEPRRTDHTLVFVQRYNRKVMEYFADVFSGKFSAPNLSERAKHLTVGGIEEIAYQQELVPSIWARRSDGTLIGAIYKRDALTTSQGPTIIGWHRHQLGSGRIVESLCVGPSVGGNLDTPSFVTNDVTTNVRHIETMTDLLDENFGLTDCWFLDGAIVPTSTVVQSNDGVNPYGSLLVNGLWPHNGKTVTAYIAGLDCGDYTVSNGSITVPFGDSVSAGTANGLFTQALVQSFATLPALVGFTYNSDGQTVRPVTQAETGAQAGPGFAKIGRSHKAGLLLFGAVNNTISIGSDFTTMYPVNLLQPNDAQYLINQQWSGIWRDEINSDLDFDGWLCWRISRPNPGFIMAVGGFDSKADV